MPLHLMKGDDEEDTALLRDAASAAERYLATQKWCRRIRERYFGAGIGGIDAVFRFRIVPIRADEWIWVVVGDLESAYLETDRGVRLWSSSSSLDVILTGNPNKPHITFHPRGKGK